MEATELQHLIDQHYTRIRRAALALCGDQWEADEIAQETFLAALQSNTSFRGDSKVETWLYGICLKLHRSRFRSAGRRLRRMSQWVLKNQKYECCDGEDTALETAEWRASIWDSVRRLPNQQREVVVLRFTEEMSVPEIADVLKCPKGTVKSRLHHGLAKLREWMENQCAGESDKKSMTADSASSCRSDLHQPLPLVAHLDATET